MEFIRQLKSIKITNDIQDFVITTIQNFDEDEVRVVLQCAERISNFTRGFTCDMDCKFSVINSDGSNNDTIVNDSIKDLVLVHIRKSVGIDSIPQFEYVFYK